MADKEARYETPIVKHYAKPKTVISPAAQKVENYLKLRGFSKETWERRKVGESGGNIVFPYYEKGNLVMVKFRKPEKFNGEGQKAWREDDGKPILWGIDLCDHKLPLIITEGEYDTLALDECGIKNVVSVPSGSQDLTWIDLCWDWLEQFNEIILWGDQDEPGKKMVADCVKRLGSWRCSIVNSARKDANDALHRDGKIGVEADLEMAMPVPIVGLLDLADVQEIDIKNLPRVASGIPCIDKAVGGFLMGELSVWTGDSGHGKSTLLGQILLNAITQGENVCAYSGELRAENFQYWINLQAAGRDNIKLYKDPMKSKEVPYLQKEIATQIKNWYRGKFKLYDNTAIGNEESGVLKIFEYAARRHGCKVFLIDNLMTSNFGEKDERDYYNAQSRFVGEIVKFCKAFGVHVHLVAHPKKTKGDIGKDDISGTGDIHKRTDNVFKVVRGETVTLTVMKHRFSGIQGVEIGLKFDDISKRFYGLSETEHRIVGWEPKASSVFDEMGEKK